MKLFLVSCFVALVAFTAGLPTGNSTDESVIRIVPRLIDGKLVSKSLYYEAAIISDAVPVKLCSGAFISTKWVLTSAYCAKRRPTLRVYYGRNYVYPQQYEGSQLVERVHCHPSYNPITLDHDAALLELGAAVSNPYVTRVEFPSTAHYTYLGLTAKVSGWGPAPGGSSTEKCFRLESKDTIVIENAFCTREGFPMTVYKLCTEDRAICDGDQGAPLVINNRVIGIATSAYDANNCRGSIVTPYTRISYYLKWINQVTGTPCTTC